MDHVFVVSAPFFDLHLFLFLLPSFFVLVVSYAYDCSCIHVYIHNLCVQFFSGEFHRTQSGLSHTSSGYDSRSSMQRAESMLSECVTLEPSMFKDLFMFDLIQACRV